MALDHDRYGSANFEGTVYLLPKFDTVLKIPVYIRTNQIYEHGSSISVTIATRSTKTFQV